MSDLIEQAEALIERYDASGFIHQDATLLLPDLIAEIKRLQDRVEYLDKRDARTLQEYGDLQEQLATWQKIAIDLKASAIQDANSGDFIDARGNHMFQVMDLEKCREQAAKELGLQVTQEAGYLERLEKAYLEQIRKEFTPGNVDDIERKARAALEKIRNGTI